ncbi:MAG: hypothetical protein V7637_4325, partial [Mycobacteriales bacterium]
MGLWKPAADPGAVGQAATLSDRLVGGLSSEGPKLSGLVPTGWSGEAAGKAAGEAGTLGKLISGFCDSTSKAAGVMRQFASDYTQLKATFDRLDADHTATQQRIAGLDREIAAYQGGALSPAEHTRQQQLITQRDEARGHLTQLESQHRSTMTEFTSAQQKAAGGLNAVTPQGLTGSPAAQAAQVKAQVFKGLPSVQEEEGRRLGQQIKDDLAKKGTASQADIDALAANAGNPDFVKGMYDTLGPAGVAALSRQAKLAMDSPYDKDHPGGKQLYDALHTSFGVAAKQGLITDDWLNKFDPKNALPKGMYHDDTNGFRADLLIPLAAGQKLPTDVMKRIGDRAMADLKSGMDSGGPQTFDKWGAYVGDDSGKGPYDKNLMREFLGDLSKDPEASNGTLMGNFDTMQRIGRGG